MHKMFRFAYINSPLETPPAAAAKKVGVLKEGHILNGGFCGHGEGRRNSIMEVQQRRTSKHLRLFTHSLAHIQQTSPVIFFSCSFMK